MTRITYEQDGYRVQIEVPHDPVQIGMVIEELVVPMLLGVGFAESSIREYIPNE